MADKDFDRVQEATGFTAFKCRYSPQLDPRTHMNLGPKIDVEADKEPRFESFILGDGEKKVEVEPETRKSPPKLNWGHFWLHVSTHLLSL